MDGLDLVMRLNEPYFSGFDYVDAFSVPQFSFGPNSFGDFDLALADAFNAAPLRFDLAPITVEGTLGPNSFGDVDPALNDLFNARVGPEASGPLPPMINPLVGDLPEATGPAPSGARTAKVGDLIRDALRTGGAGSGSGGSLGINAPTFATLGGAPTVPSIGVDPMPAPLPYPAIGGASPQIGGATPQAPGFQPLNVREPAPYQERPRPMDEDRDYFPEATRRRSRGLLESLFGGM